MARHHMSEGAGRDVTVSVMVDAEGSIVSGEHRAGLVTVDRVIHRK